MTADELFQDPSLLAHRLFDRRTNPLVEEVVNRQPELFVGWTERDFDELYSRFAAGGSLTEEGALAAVACDEPQSRNPSSRGLAAGKW